MAELTTLLERCRQGDGLAWEALVRQFQGRIYAVALHYSRNSEEARDMAQEIFIRVYSRLGSFHGDHFVPWMLRLARNLCIDKLRRKKARPVSGEIAMDDAPEMVDEAPTPEENWFSDRKQQLVYRAMGRMSEQNREMILLKEIQGLNLQEIADLLQAPLGTVKSRSNRARLELARAVIALDPSYGA
ncbi:MAG: sigma-70 family RNA polymerase sigma factor [bacterium]|nr:sigma-70 family RNA polymerase sigma factor [bacterium]